MAKIEFSQGEKAEIVGRLQQYFRAELNRELGRFEAEFLLDFFNREIGAYIYNQALTDARAVLAKRLENLDDALYEIEQPIPYSRTED